MPRIEVEVTDAQLEALRQLGRSERWDAPVDAGEVLAELTRYAADGVRRPGAWERGWIEEAFGPLIGNGIQR